MHSLFQTETVMINILGLHEAGELPGGYSAAQCVNLTPWDNDTRPVDKPQRGFGLLACTQTSLTRCSMRQSELTWPALTPSLPRTEGSGVMALWEKRVIDLHTRHLIWSQSDNSGSIPCSFRRVLATSKHSPCSPYKRFKGISMHSSSSSDTNSTEGNTGQCKKPSIH